MKIFINGKEYSNLDEVPELPELFKKVLRDNNNNGMPDMMEKVLGETDPEDLEDAENRIHAVQSLKQDSHIVPKKSYNQGLAPLIKGDNGVARLIFVVSLVGIGYVLFQVFSGAWE